MATLKIGQKANAPCGDCGSTNTEVQAFKTVCRNCGASIDPFTGHVFISGHIAIEKRKPTSGNWYMKSDIHDNGDFTVQILSVEDGNNYPSVIANLDGFIGNGDGREAEENGKLMAGAKAMYKALKQVDFIYTEYMALRPDPNDKSFNIVQIAMSDIHKAIKKVETEE